MAVRRCRRLWVAPLVLVVVGGASSLPARGEEAASAKSAEGVPAAPEAAFQEGELAREEGRWNDAADAYWRALQADARHYRAHVRYQEASLAAGKGIADLEQDYAALQQDFAGVEDLALHCLRLKPVRERLPLLQGLAAGKAENANALLEIGRAHLALGSAKDALAALDEAAALLPPERQDGLLLRAEAQIMAGRSAEARKLLENAVEVAPGFGLGALVLARIALREGDAEECLARTETLLAHHPSHLAALLLRGEALLALGRAPESIKLLEAAQELAPESAPILLALADANAREVGPEALARATQLYEGILARDGENVHAHYGLGWVREREGKFVEAEKRYREVLALQPQMAEVINAVGYTLLRQGRFSEAQPLFRRASSIDPTFVSALANLAATHDAQEKFAEGIKIYERILKMKGQAKNLRALLNCAFDYEMVANFGQAVKLLETAHEVRPDVPDIVVWLGDNHYFQKKWRSAEKWYRQAIEMKEDLQMAWRGLGFTLVQRERWEDAAFALARASTLDPKDLEVLLALGDIYWLELKDSEKALQTFEAYRAAGGDEPSALDAIDELRRELDAKK